MWKLTCCCAIWACSVQRSAGAPNPRGEAVQAGLVRPGEETASGGPKTNPPVITRGLLRRLIWDLYWGALWRKRDNGHKLKKKQILDKVVVTMKIIKEWASRLECPCDAARQPILPMARQKPTTGCQPAPAKQHCSHPQTKDHIPLQQEGLLNYKLFTSGNNFGVLHSFKTNLAEKYTIV